MTDSAHVIEILDIIELCNEGLSLQEFRDEVLDAFEGDTNYEIYSKFQRAVIEEHFQKQLSNLIRLA